MPILGVIASSAKGAPGIPTGVTATDVGTSRAYNNGAASVAFTSGAGATATSFTVTSSPGGYTASGASSPITVTGLQSSVGYTYTVTATNAAGTSDPSTASASVTATTVPQAPTIGTATAGNASATVAYTAGATGGKTVTAYTATSSPGSFTGTGASPITVSGLTNGTGYTFTVTATNANGTSTASAASNSVTPAIPALSAWSSVGSYPLATGYLANTTGGGYLWGAGGRSYSPSTIQSNAYRSTDGATWSSISALPAARWALPGAYDGTYFQVFSGYNSSNVDQTTSYYNNGSSWATGTALPFANQGAGAAWSIGSAVGTNGYWAGAPEARVYYRTGTGAWSTGTDAPLNVGAGFTPDGFSFGAATNRTDRSVAYGTAPHNPSGFSYAQFYSSSNIAGAWSSFGPAATNLTSFRSQSAYANGFLFGWGGDAPTNAVMRSDGSTISSQTVYPVNITQAGSGAIGNDIYGFTGGSTTTTAIQTVYRATQN